VVISPSRKGGGKIEIEYYTDEELDRLCGLLNMKNVEEKER